MKRETKYTETNETKRNVTKFTAAKRNETKWNVHKNWKGMQFRETNIPKRNKTEYVETYMSVPSPIWMTIGHINGCSCRRSCGWLFLSMFMWLSVNTSSLAKGYDPLVKMSRADRNPWLAKMRWTLLDFFFFSISIQKDANNRFLLLFFLLLPFNGHRQLVDYSAPFWVCALKREHT